MEPDLKRKSDQKVARLRMIRQRTLPRLYLGMQIRG